MLALWKGKAFNAAMDFREDGVWLTPPEAVHIQTISQAFEAGDIWNIVRLGCIDWVDSIVAVDEPSNLPYEQRYIARWQQARATWQPRNGEVICAPMPYSLLHDLGQLMVESAAHNRYIVEHLDEYIAKRELEGVTTLKDADDDERQALRTDLLDAAMEDVDLEEAIAGAIERHLETKS